MDENPTGTPNPLNPVVPAEPAEPVISQPAEQPALVGQPIPVEQPAQPVIEPQKKSKKPILIAAIILILVAIGSAVAAVAILKPFAAHDAVPAAISKLFSVGAPKKVTMEGAITAHDRNEGAAFTSMLINFSSKLNAETTENSVTANINATLSAEETFAFDASEIHTADGDLYLKLSGIVDALGSFRAAEANCAGDETGLTNCATEESPAISILNFLDVFDVIDDEWIRIPSSDFSNLDNLVSVDGMTTCLINAAGNLSEYGNNFVSLYNTNPFVEYSTANLDITKKKDPLYRLSFNADKLTAFINSIGNAGFMNELLACTGGLATNEAATVEEVSNIVAMVPAIYVEIDDNDNFTRLYMVVTSEDGLNDVSADVSFGYPETAISVEAPTYYIDLGDLLAQILSDFYGTDIVEMVPEEPVY